MAKANPTLSSILADLKGLSDPKIRAVWGGLDVRTPDQFYGVGLAGLKGYAGGLKKSHELALELWACGVHDAKLLSTMIEDGRKVTEGQARAQINDIYSCDLCDSYCRNVLAQTSFGFEMIEGWLTDGREMVRRAAYCLLCAQARQDVTMTNAYFLGHLGQIKGRLQSERNWVKEMMNEALIAIGERNPVLNKAAVAARRAIGRVTVLYGDTPLKITDALAVLTGTKLKLRYA